MQLLTLRDHQKASLKYRWLLRVVYTLALAPVVWLVHSKNLHLEIAVHASNLTREFWQDAHWAFAQPVDFWPPVIAILGDATGLTTLPAAFIPISSMILGGCLLGSISASLNRQGNHCPTMVVIAMALGCTPLFFGPMAVGDPIFWGPGAWFFAVRSLARIESRDMFQYELALGFCLAILMLLDPAAPLMVLGVLLFLPLILPGNSRRSYLEALVLTIFPAITVVFLQISSFAIFNSLPLVKAYKMWSSRIPWSVDFFRFAYDYHAKGGTSGPLPHFFRSALHVTPLLPLAFFLPTIRSRKFHPGTLGAVIALPLFHGLLYSAHAGAASHRVWLLYLILGMMAWLAETPINGRWGRVFTFIICLWPLAVGWVAVLS